MLGLLAGNKFALKSAVKHKFVDLFIAPTTTPEYKSPTNRIRDIDSWRQHSPISEERELLRIPDSLERLNLHSKTHILMICGGYAGLRFTSEDMREVDFLCHQLEISFIQLDSYFKSLSNAAKKYVVSSMAPPEPVEVSHSLLPPLPPLPDYHEETLAFHGFADTYLSHLAALQALVRRKQVELVQNKLDGVDVGDVENFSHLPPPAWVHLLTSKFWKTINNDIPKAYTAPPLGSFAAYLSTLLASDVLLTEDEKLALQELCVASCGLDSEAALKHTPGHTQKYWAKTFFNFMKKLPEFKTSLKDEKSLYAFATYM